MNEIKQAELHFNMSQLLMLKNPCFLMQVYNSLSAIFDLREFHHGLMNA